VNVVNGTDSPYPTPRLAWYTVIILMLCVTLSYADRQILAFLVGPLKQDLHITDTQIGFLQGFAFAFFFTFSALPFGMVADRFKRRTVIAIGVFLWSLMTCLSSLARSFPSLAAARVGVGIGEASLTPCGFSMLSDSFPKERLATALSVFSMGIQIGSGIALIVGGMVAQAVAHLPPVDLPVFGPVAGWRLTFLVVGAPGLLMSLVMFTVREPVRRAVLLDAHGVGAPLGLGEIFRQLGARARSTFGIALMIAAGATSNTALLAWGPEFFARVHEWPKGRTGLVLGCISLICGCAGLATGGRLADYWHGKGVPEGALRVGLISVIGVACTLAPAMMMSDAAWTVALIAPAVFFLGLPTGCGYAAVQIIYPNQMRGVASSAVTFVVAMMGIGLGAQLPGVFNDHLFHNGLMTGTSIALTVWIASAVGVLGILSALGKYRSDYREIHPGTTSPPAAAALASQN
jgi:MFS family permease